jgi:aryl-alcohol dehydrogenase-like predicted oxidoreductase
MVSFPFPKSVSASDLEWRNVQAEMAYRRLGRTNLMVSEFMSGGSKISPDNVKHLEVAIERGLNFIDTAPAYGRGKSEKGLSQILNPSSKRERVFVNSKVSFFDNTRNKTTEQIYQKLTSTQKEEIDNEIERRIKSGYELNPDYTIPYYREDLYESQIRDAYLADAIERHFPEKINRQILYYQHIIDSVEKSLERLQTDYLDIIMCPHGVSSPREMHIHEILEAFEKLKKDGKVRFLGASAHSNPAGMVMTAATVGHYDVAMPAFSFINAKYFDAAFKAAKKVDMGIIAMKTAKPFTVIRNDKLRFPQAIQRLEKAVPEVYPIWAKAYLWVLSHDNISSINSDMPNEQYVKDNLALTGKRITLKG